METDSNWSSMPTIEQLSKDPFMKQVQHGAQLSWRIQEQLQEQSTAHTSTTEEDEKELLERLIAQLSHSDGIRGFFVAYLTTEDDTNYNESVSIPECLKEAMNGVDPNELVPLACMNVIMPTAMISMHQDAEQSNRSRRTSQRGLAVLKALVPRNDDTDDQPTAAASLVESNCQAILAVAKGREYSTNASLQKYWEDFFQKWGYQEQQRQDIANVMEAILHG